MRLRQLLPTATDAAAFKGLRIVAMQESPRSFSSSVLEEEECSVESIQTMLSSSRRFQVGVFDNSRLVAIAGLVHQTRLKTQHKADIFGVYVLPEFRGQGWSRRMMQTIIEHAKQQAGLEVLLLTVTEGNITAHRLYSSLGFLEYGIEPDAMRVDGQPIGEILMQLKLRQSP
jgi:RimJ/RimL family protein N-acetyltransferase